MTIKSDKWIKQQCTPASFMVTEMVAQPQDPRNMLYFPPIVKERAVYMTAAEIEQSIGTRQQSNQAYRLADALGIFDYRPLTAEEKAAFVPMISPFEPNNMRYLERQATAAERDIYNTMGSKEGTTVARDSWRRIDDVQGLILRDKILSYGTSSFGYDVTLQDEFRIFTNINSSIIDPLSFDEKCLVEFKGDVCIIPPNSYILGVTREYFRIPRDVMVVCVGKSTYARCGAIVNTTPIEPGFEGHVVIEISNATNLPMKIYANQGVAQFMFFKSDEECETSYADKGGKYQGQTGMTLAKG